ncbi:hypothetical protein SETIT_8G135300v2 [Setaria italica]|uniref:Uncharacterized protein n=1 Tax=Setaria italica TaxID=4555 RepID=A0A368S7I9_SETIT|nr:hypothetical protein SETIT_8G135300v2 [Setaria italica]
MLSRLLPCWWSSHALAPTHVLTGRRSIEGEDGCMHHDSMRTFYCALEEEDSMFRGTNFISTCCNGPSDEKNWISKY